MESFSKKDQRVFSTTRLYNWHVRLIVDRTSCRGVRQQNNRVIGVKSSFASKWQTPCTIRAENARGEAWQRLAPRLAPRSQRGPRGPGKRCIPAPGEGWPCHFATVSRSRPRRRAMLDTDTPSSLKTWIWLHCCIVITSAASSCDDVGVAAEGRAASAAVTNAGFLAIPRYKCGFLGDHFCWFSMITSAGFHPIRDTGRSPTKRPGPRPPTSPGSDR